MPWGCRVFTDAGNWRFGLVAGNSLDSPLAITISRPWGIGCDFACLGTRRSPLLSRRLVSQCLGFEAATALGMDSIVPAYWGSLLRGILCHDTLSAIRRREPRGHPDDSLSSDSACAGLGIAPIRSAP